ncbi:MAG: tRNA pseudouridine(38-40) synthase TruA [Symbiobacteriia bacterium]
MAGLIEPGEARRAREQRSRNIRLLVQYDGTELHGFQRQKGQISVQEALERAVHAVTGEPPLLAAAGRTDAGVHALGQVVNFYTSSSLPTGRFPWALNAHLPEAIAVQAAYEAPRDFHARFSAHSKLYRYSIQNSRFPAPLVNRYAYLWREPLDAAAMDRAAACLVGHHDFAAFRATGSAARTSERQVIACRVTASALEGTEGGRLVQVWVAADGFLYNMVRIIAGTLLEVGAGRRDPDDLPQVLASKDRGRAGRTLPPHGLCLMRVDYGESGGGGQENPLNPPEQTAMDLT